MPGSLALDNISFSLRAPTYADRHPGQHGRMFFGDGQIKSEKDMERILLPDPRNPELYREAEQFAKNKGDYSAWFVTRIGIFPAMLSLGLTTFSLALYDNRPFVEKVMDLYFDWTRIVAEHVCQLGFDAFVTTDDLAFKTQPFFAPQIFRELVVPRCKRVAEKITIPWIWHTDGNVAPLLEDFISLGIAGLHPIEKGAMDIRRIKADYGNRVCLLGNVDLNLLGAGTPEEVDRGSARAHPGRSARGRLHRDFREQPGRLSEKGKRPGPQRGRERVWPLSHLPLIEGRGKEINLGRCSAQRRIGKKSEHIFEERTSEKGKGKSL